MNKIVYALVGFFFLCMHTSMAQTIELEEGELEACTVGTAIAGYSGAGYVAGFDRYSVLTLNVNVEQKGEYDFYLKYELDATDSKPISYTINGVAYSLIYPVNVGSFIEGDFLRLPLMAGDNTVVLRTGRGTTFNLDYIRLVKYNKELNLNPAVTLINPNATAETVALYNYFLSVYGNHTITGQTELKYCEFLSGVTGRSPKLCAFDFMGYTKDPTRNVDDAIAWANEHNGIVSFQWHWANPMNKGGSFYSYPKYSDGTDFDASKIFEPTSPEYAAMIDDIDLVSGYLLTLQNNNIPVLWRPLHEATGDWFWWSTGSGDRAAACKQIWNVMYDRMVNHHGLNNLIWVWNTEGRSFEDEWYPGNDKVDILGADKYGGGPGGSWSAVFERVHLRHEGAKMVALSECGSVPDPQNLIDDVAPWLYFCVWNNMIMDMEKNPRALLRRAYNTEYYITNTKLDVDTILDPTDNPTLPDAYEAEDAVFSGTLKVSKIFDGFRGTGYVGGFSGDNDKLTFTVNSDEAKEFDLYIGYHITSGWGNKGTYVNINNAGETEVLLIGAATDIFQETTPIKINLVKGVNTIEFTKNWGYYDIDYIRIPKTPTSIDPAVFDNVQVILNNQNVVQVTLPEVEVVHSVAVYNTSGQLITFKTTPSLTQLTSFSLATEPSGVYFVVVKSVSNIRKTFKVIR